MEIKQYSLKTHGSKKKITREMRKCLERNETDNTTHNMQDIAKAVLKGNFIAINAYIKKDDFNNLVLHLFLLLFSFSCSNFPLLLSPTLLTPPSWLPYSIPTLLSMAMAHLYLFFNQTLPILSFLISLSLSLWSLVCSLFPCLWFACLFHLFIRFLLQVRSYGICVQLPGLFHLALCSLVSSMLSQRVGVLSFFLLHTITLYKS